MLFTDLRYTQQEQYLFIFKSFSLNSAGLTVEGVVVLLMSSPHVLINTITS